MKIVSVSVLYGEIATLGTNQYEGVQTLDILGIDRRRVADWRKVSDGP